jgi:hypothetical protein
MCRFIGGLTTKGAVSPWQRRPTMKVCVFQCPNVALGPRGSPSGSGHAGASSSWAVSSMRLKRHLRLSQARPSRRACLTSAPILFAGRQRFFEAIAAPDEPARDRGGIRPDAGGGCQFSRQLRHNNVVLPHNASQQKRAVELGMSPAAAGLGLKASSPAVGLHQIHDKRNQHPKMASRRVPRSGVLNKAGNPLAKGERIGLRQRKSPPPGSESQTKPHRNPPIQPDNPAI